MIHTILYLAKMWRTLQKQALWENLTVVRRYFRCSAFARSYCWLKLCYLLDNPYRCSKRYWRQQGIARRHPHPFTYGETPLTVLHQIMVAAKVSKQDHVFELGAGSGYTSLWLRCVLGCRVTAIERIPVFCWRLHRTVQRMRITGINVCCQDLVETDLSQATVLYLYGSTLDEPTIKRLAQRIARLSPGTRIITVSYSLSDYANNNRFKLINQLTVDFDWGAADVFIQIVISATEE